MILAALLAAQAVPAPPPGYVLDPPPCPQGKTECQPWERQWKGNVFDQFDPKPLGNGPHTLVVSANSSVTQFEYKSGPACQRARDAIWQQVGSRKQPDGTYVYSPVIAYCVPR